MNEAGFRAWLEANYSSNTVATKLSEARQLAKAYGDLDALYEEDQLDSVMESLRYSSTEKALNRPNPSKVPLTSDLYRDLSNLRTTVNYYRRYSGDKRRPRPDLAAVNKAIDECVALGLDAFLDSYGFGKDIDYWVVRDGSRYPSKAVFGVAHQFMTGGAPLDGKSCNGTEARLHLEKLGFEIAKGKAVESAEPPITLFDAGGAAYVPEKQQNRATGVIAYRAKPVGAQSNKASEAQEIETDLGIVQAILVDRLPARIRPLGGGTPNYLKYGADKLVSYRLRADIAKAMKGLSEMQENVELGSHHRGAVNLILYGPPGTGKTYATVVEAVRLCDRLAEDDALLTDPQRRTELKARYDELVEARRVDFVTFHQNYSYEEFVEGLRPTQGNSEAEDAAAGGAGFSLSPEEGVFRRIARRAAASRGGGGHYEIGDRRIFKLSIGEAANPEDDYLFEEAIAEGHALLGYGDIDWSDARFDERDAFIQACLAYHREHPDNGRPAPTPQTGRVQCPMIFRNWMKQGDLVIVSKGNSKFRAIGEVAGEYEYAPRPTGVYSHRRKVRWLWIDKSGAAVEDIYAKRFSMRSVYLMTRSDVSIPALEAYINSQQSDGGSSEPEPYVLVIDEINRGNISKIFGELITLIEPDKRTGEANAIELRLPYSREPFSVPTNLHIIGTMNTADRSIALLDTALRRRFVFRELAPDASLLPETVEGVPLRRVMEVINDRIEYLVDREHRIGHAFFLGDGSRDRAAIDATMRDKVIPLLQEYFFEDWARVAAVLGERPGKGGAFLECRKLRDPTGGEGEERESWSVRRDFAPDAYDRLIGKPVVVTSDTSPDETSE